ncbi:MAG: YbjN domain-containing protein [Myxococcota bacterium]
MTAREDIESYLMRSNLSFKSVGDDPEDSLWLVQDPNTQENIVVSLSGPVVVFRVRVMELEGVADRSGLYERLLRLNVSDIVHGCYGIEDDHVVLTAGLFVENLDYNEFQGTVDDMTLALTNHYESLATFRPQGAV